MAALQEGDNDFLGGRVDPRRVRLGDNEPRDARSVLEIRLAAIRPPQRVADEALAIPREVRMEGQAVDRLDPLRSFKQIDRFEFPGQVEEEFCPGVLIVGEGIEDAGLLADNEPVAPRISDDEQRMLKLQIREHAHHIKRRRWVGRSHNPGGRPGCPVRKGGRGGPGLASIDHGRSRPRRE